MSAPRADTAVAGTTALTAAAVAAQPQSEAIRSSLADFIRRLWAALGVYRNEQIPTFLGELLPVLQAAQEQMSTLTQAHLELQGVRLARVDLADVSGAAIRNGTSPETVYERPFHLVWRQLHDLPREEGAIEQAIEAGLNRAILSAQTDLQLTKVHTAEAVVAEDPKVVGYRRVLEGDYSCGLCIVASTQRYRKTTKFSIHPGDDCSYAAILGTEDPGPIINAPLLEKIHTAIYETFGDANSGAREIRGTENLLGDLIQYRDVLVTHSHGELGDVLAVRGAPFLSLTN